MELQEKSIWREQLSSQYPGFSSFYFEQIFNIIMEHVVGWNMKKGTQAEIPGLFGDIDAFIATIEEQARTCLYCHIGIFSKSRNKLVHDLYSKREKTAELAKRKLIKNVILLLQLQLLWILIFQLFITNVISINMKATN